jgi:hypothetical protein
MLIIARLAKFTAQVWAWFDNHIIELFRQVRLSYLSPLMVSLAAGMAGLTGIVGTFLVKDYLGLPAEFLAMLGFWAGIPKALKMPLGHLVDLIWRWAPTIKALQALQGVALFFSVVQDIRYRDASDMSSGLLSGEQPVLGSILDPIDPQLIWRC